MDDFLLYVFTISIMFLPQIVGLLSILLLDKKSDLLGFLEDGYEPFHLMGVEGIMDEVERFIEK